jgi:uncharacterized protein
MPRISEIYIYPIKALAGISLQSAVVTERGLQHDRRWVLVDESNYHITQREFAELALLDVAVVENGLIVKHRTKDFDELFISFAPQTADYQTIRVWNDEIETIRVSDDADKWFSDILGINCRLFYQPENSIRPVDARYAIQNDHVNLSDGYPILIAGQASIDDLSRRIGIETTIKRFRPNLVFTGGEAFEEDTWGEFKINDTVLHGVKNCARCPVPNIDPQTAEISKEVIKTLASYRTRNNKVLFGQNLLVRQTGVISVGDEVKINY